MDITINIKETGFLPISKTQMQYFRKNPGFCLSPKSLKTRPNQNYRRQTHSHRHNQHYHRLILSPDSPADRHSEQVHN